jgi:peptidoglycan/LPS O-acetylase OafA/YrhL
MSGPTTDLRPRGRLTGVDGLRALAAGSVLLYHCYLYGSPGGPAGGHVLRLAAPNLALGVTVFFTLSGFLLWRPFAAALLSGQERPNTRNYLRNRALRILPAYWAVLLICGLVLGAALVRRSSSSVALAPLHDPLQLLGAGTLVQNLSPSTLENGLGPAWTLAVEVAFYLALPAFAGLAFRLAGSSAERRRRRAAAALPALALLVIGVSGKLTAASVAPAAQAHLPVAAGTYHYPADWHTVLALSPWAQADLFAFGLLLAVIEVEVHAGRLSLPARWRRATLAAACVVGIPALVAVHGHQLGTSLANTAIALTFALLLALLVIEPRRDRVAIRVLEWRPLVLIGLASYSVFLWNDALERVLERRGLTLGGVAGLPVNAAMLALVVGACSLVSYRLVERPALRRKKRLAERPATGLAGVAVR